MPLQVREFTSKGTLPGANGAAVAVPAGSKLHIVTPTDTIQGLAIRYDTTVERLRKLNGLPGARSIHERNELVVPVGAGAVVPGSPAVDNPNVAEFRQLARFAIVQVGTRYNPIRLIIRLISCTTPPPTPTHVHTTTRYRYAAYCVIWARGCCC